MEKELRTALEEKERAFGYHGDNGKAVFEEDVLSQHRRLKQRLFPYVLPSRFLAHRLPSQDQGLVLGVY